MARAHQTNILAGVETHKAWFRPYAGRSGRSLDLGVCLRAGVENQPDSPAGDGNAHHMGKCRSETFVPPSQPSSSLFEFTACILRCGGGSVDSDRRLTLALVISAGSFFSCMQWLRSAADITISQLILPHQSNLGRC